MNFTALNAAPLNTGVLDATIRGAVFGSAYAMAQPQARLLQRASGAGTTEFGQAIASPTGKSMTRLGLTAPSGQAQASPRLRILSRSPTAEQASAVASPSIRTILLRMSAQASAQAVPVVRAMQRDVGGRQASAAASLVARILARNTVNELAAASATPTGRGLSRSPVNGQAAAAAAALRLTAILRSANTEFASAIGYVGGSTVIKYVYDLPAIADNTFVVPFEDNIFYVR